LAKKELTTQEQITLLTGTCDMNNQQHMSNSSTFYTKKAVPPDYKISPAISISNKLL